MAIYDNGKVSYAGAVLREESHMWMDGMEDVFAVVWDGERVKMVKVGYYGSDGCNLLGMDWDIDATDETRRAVRRWLKKSAWYAFEDSIIAYKKGIRKGTHAEVVKGRKVKVGTKLEVFWIGERPTYMSRMNSWMHESEKIAGCYDADGNKVWIKAEYLKSVDDIKSPNAKERKKFINNYIEREAKRYGA